MNTQIWFRNPSFGGKPIWLFFLSPPKTGITSTQIQESSLSPSPSPLVPKSLGNKDSKSELENKKSTIWGKTRLTHLVDFAWEQEATETQIQKQFQCSLAGKSLEFRAEENPFGIGPRCRKTLETLIQTPIEKNSLFLLGVIVIVAFVSWNRHYQPWCS